MKTYFTIQELIKSDTAIKYRIDNKPKDTKIIYHMQLLINNLLNPLREAWGSAIIVNSGYRCPELNKIVGGAKVSAHLTGYAADLKPANGKIKEFIKFTQDWCRTSGIPFDQCINEYDRWIHLGYKNNSGIQRKQIFKL